MKRNTRFFKFLLSMTALLTATAAFGQETTPTGIIVNGVALTKKVKSIEMISSPSTSSFGVPAETVVITYENSDGKEVTESYYPTTVEQWFGDPTGIRDLTIYDAGEQEGKLTLDGLKPGSTVRVYDTSGNLRHILTAGEHTSIDLSVLPRGIYIVRSGKTAIKLFNK